MRETAEMLWQGGWPMVPIGLCSVIALTLIFERAWALRRVRVLPPKVLRVLERYDGEDAASPAIVVCQGTEGPFARLMAEVIGGRHLEHAQAIERLHAIGRTQVAELERGLTVLEIIAGVSPLMGLLGTVLGMVRVFNAITAQGLGDPQVLSSGISQALITTVAGLCVAIPALAFHSLFAKRVDDLAAEMQDRATRFLVEIQRETGH